MRIVSGIYGGRRLEAPKGRDVRPTSDKIRGAVFNILRARVDFENFHVIDACCGTGALGLEALSQGAAFCVFIDDAKESVECCKRNIAALGAGESSRVIQKDVVKIGGMPEGFKAAGLVFLDPPYRKEIIAPALAAMRQGGWIAPGALCVAEAESEWQPQLPEGFTMLDERLYGDTKIALLRHG